MVILGATLTLSNSHSAVGGPGNAAEKAQNLEVQGEEPSKVSMADDAEPVPHFGGVHQ